MTGGITHLNVNLILYYDLDMWGEQYCGRFNLDFGDLVFGLIDKDQNDFNILIITEMHVKYVYTL